MKTIFKIIIAIVILAVILIGFLVYSNGAKSLNSEVKPAPANTTENKPLVESSLLTVVNNTVQIKKISDETFMDVAGGSMDVEGGTHVKTSLTGRALVESKNSATVTVDKNSDFIITENNQNKTYLNLLAGNLWARVQKLLGQGEYFQVQTPNSVATVRGTSFGVFYENSITTVIVSESQVALISIDPITKKQIGPEVIINAGQRGTVKDGQAPVVESLTEADKAMDWYAYNNPRLKPAPEVKDSGSPTKR